MKRVVDLWIKWDGGNGINRGHESSKFLMNQEIIFLMKQIIKPMMKQCLGCKKAQAQTHKLEQDPSVLKVICYPLVQEGNHGNSGKAALGR